MKESYHGHNFWSGNFFVECDRRSNRQFTAKQIQALEGKIQRVNGAFQVKLPDVD